MSTLQKFNILLFLIAILNVQFIASIEITNLTKSKTSTPSEHFEQLCYYELKQDLIIKNYVEKVKLYVSKFFLKNKIAKKDQNEINFSLFWLAFKEGRYGEVASDLAGSEDYVKSYWTHFVTKGSKTMTEAEFTRFIGLYYLEGELLVEEKHPTLSEFFPNEHNINQKIACNVAIGFWYLTQELLQRMFIEFKWSDSTQVITKTEIFTIITNTHSGKCWITAEKKCKFFSEYIGNILGFFNMSGGNRQALTIEETKLAYSTMLFQDISEPVCKQFKFDATQLQKQINQIRNLILR
jgi:hypothetical protein